MPSAVGAMLEEEATFGIQSLTTLSTTGFFRTANSHTASRQPAAALFLTRYLAPTSYSTSAGKAVSVSWSRQRATPVGLKPEPHAHASGASSSLNTSCLWTLCTPRIFFHHSIIIITAILPVHLCFMRIVSVVQAPSSFRRPPIDKLQAVVADLPPRAALAPRHEP